MVEQTEIPKAHSSRLPHLIQIRVDKKRKAFLFDQAKRHGVSMSDVLRFYVDEKMKEQEK